MKEKEKEVVQKLVLGTTLAASGFLFALTGFYQWYCNPVREIFDENAAKLLDSCSSKTLKEVLVLTDKNSALVWDNRLFLRVNDKQYNVIQFRGCKRPTSLGLIYGASIKRILEKRQRLESHLETQRKFTAKLQGQAYAAVNKRAENRFSSQGRI